MVGYVWSISRHLALSLGGRLDETDFSQAGYGELVGQSTKFNYNYRINVTTLDAVFRIIANVGRWKYYGEFIVGDASLDSNSYMLNDSLINNSYSSKRVNNITQGIGAGIMFSITKHTNLGFSIDYINLGLAKLGNYQVFSDSVSKGVMQQQLAVVTGMISIVQWF